MSTSPASRIARKLNASIQMGGKLAFAADGSGGTWYSDTSSPDAPIVISVPTVKLTAAQVQARYLDAREQ